MIDGKNDGTDELEWLTWIVDTFRSLEQSVYHIFSIKTRTNSNWQWAHVLGVCTLCAKYARSPTTVKVQSCRVTRSLFVSSQHPDIIADIAASEPQTTCWKNTEMKTPPFTSWLNKASKKAMKAWPDYLYTYEGLSLTSVVQRWAYDLGSKYRAAGS